MNVTVFGTGYVGLVQGAMLADVGHHAQAALKAKLLEWAEGAGHALSVTLGSEYLYDAPLPATAYTGKERAEASPCA
ncbi:hypothetical protein LY623_04785 [Halomonas sp. M5N1S15]|nr:hypothetical protein [Halomonas alkalisoli]MCE9681650.1 hypothetical protein [Halomonas alkalisoli]